MADSSSLTIDAATLQPVMQPAATPQAASMVVDAVTANPRRDTSGNTSTADSRGTQARAVNFRAVLNAVSFPGFAVNAGAVGSDRPQRAQKMPESEPVELSAEESAGLYATGQVSRGGSSNNGPDRVYRAATQRYVQAFFAGQPTFARPGEALELTA